MTIEPMAVRPQPILPMVVSFSLRKYAAMTALTRTLSAPNGVTSVAGTKPYAAKLHSSPTPTFIVVVVVTLS